MRALASSPASTVELIELDREECLRLLAATHFGRLAVTGPGETPVIRPVNYRFDSASQSVVIRTAPGSKFHALLARRRACFEIDGGDPAISGSGWSVIVSGVAEQISAATEIARLGGDGPEPAAPGEKEHLVRVRAFTVSGRRIEMQPTGAGV